MASGDKVVIASKEHVANSILNNIVDDVNTDDSTKSVSAKQVKILNDRTIKNDEDGIINGSLEVTDRLIKGGSDIYNSVQLQGVIGNINNPLLDLPLNNSLVMKTGVGSVTFSRSSGATYIDRYGVMQTVSDDEPRFEKDGLLVEGPSTNIKLYSQITDDAFSKARCSITDNDSTAPNNATEAAKVTVTEDGSVYIYRRNTSEDEVTYTSSWFVKNGTTDGLFTLRFHANTFGDGCAVDFDLNTGEITDNRGADNATIEALANGWFRLSITSTSDTDSDDDDYMDLLYLTKDGVTDDYFYVWGNQLEKLPFATSYIPTTDDEVTRVSDFCYIDNVGSIPYAGEDFSIVFDYTPITPTSNTNNAAWFNSIQSEDGSSIVFIFKYNYDNNSIIFITKDEEGELTYISGYKRHKVDKTIRVCGVYDSKNNTVSIYIDGVLEISKVLTKKLYSYGKPTRFKLNGFGDDSAIYGTGSHTITNLKIFNKALTSVEVNLI